MHPNTESLQAILKAYNWYDHPEGPKFVETHRDAYRTSGHWLFLPGAISAFHQVLNNEELWLIHQGRLRVHVIDSEGQHTVHQLGMNIQAGERPVITVPLGYWQAAELPEGEAYAFGTNVCAPCFEFQEFRLGLRDEMIAMFPQHEVLIGRLAQAV
ncbi:MAG: cupin domain-containing protein [Microscillaceae bacterium]|nr:cupin domain-containing protein [Microscillaceae bacterium]